eukprot:CAMPEP_0181258058 /NCGR_PEP_ID=MMETSP1096-20121128/50579_1 /TAXON_ID=156174 ORGANISM="Chrysochromulina ericina, Strain CCMP281" /NCGR_SAMPLE_ID=MMETSP1096 /ASSEMBLY_ACC=CAM_ASM_000453 /LENGTH=78 /DNA_ID=CAMNT_0023356425 /DNA_START=28 /DNA_END=264 /DNA_ORIENTATION=+
MTQLHTRILKGNHQPFPSSTSNRVRVPIRRMLTVDVAERVTAERLQEGLATSFQLGGNGAAGGLRGPCSGVDRELIGS